MPTVRQATSEDIPALIGLLGQLFTLEPEFVPDPEKQARGIAALLADERNGRILVAEKDGNSVGMVNLLYVVSTALGARAALLEDVVIDQSCRRRGYGKKLLTSAIEMARADGCERITVLSDASNAEAHSFYKGFGFERSTMVPFRLDALEVACGLKPAQYAHPRSHRELSTGQNTSRTITYPCSVPAKRRQRKVTLMAIDTAWIAVGAYVRRCLGRRRYCLPDPSASDRAPDRYDVRSTRHADPFKNGLGLAKRHA